MRRIEPRPVFAAYRPHFDEERAATQAEDWDVADELHREIKSPLRLADPDDVDVAELLLHVQGDAAVALELRAIR